MHESGVVVLLCCRASVLVAARISQFGKFERFRVDK